MRQPIAIPAPTAGELEALATLYRTTWVVRLRTRAQMVLLAVEQRLKERRLRADCQLFALSAIIHRIDGHYRGRSILYVHP